MERTLENEEVINKLIGKMKDVDEIGAIVADKIEAFWREKGKFLPVLISASSGNLNQDFLYALNEALKREHKTELTPDTFYSIAIRRIEDWEKNYQETCNKLNEELVKFKKSVHELKAELQCYSKSALGLFMEIYPKITSGSEFNPLAVSEVIPLYPVAFGIRRKYGAT